LWGSSENLSAKLPAADVYTLNKCMQIHEKPGSFNKQQIGTRLHCILFRKEQINYNAVCYNVCCNIVMFVICIYNANMVVNGDFAFAGCRRIIVFILTQVINTMSVFIL